MYTLPTGARYLSAFLLLAGLTLFWNTPNAYAQIPQTLNYQGFLTDSQGGMVPDGTYELTVAFYDTATGGTALWTETQTVSTVGGVFSVLLGSTNPLALPFDRAYWLGTSIDGEPELEPRAPLSAAPYSLTNRGTVNEPASGDSFTIRTADGGTAHVLSPNGDVMHTGKGTFEGGIVVGDSLDTDGAGKQRATASVGVFGRGTSVGLQGQSSKGLGVWGISESGTGVRGESQNGEGEAGAGVFGFSPAGWGVRGLSFSSYGVRGQSIGSYGVFGESDVSLGVFGLSTSSVGAQGQSTSGTGVFGVSETGSGVVGQSTSGAAGQFNGRVEITQVPEDATNTRMLVWGSDNVVKWRTVPTGGDGDGIWSLVDGNAVSSSPVSVTSDEGTGIRGLSTSGIGVFGQSQTNDGVVGKSTSGDGVFGESVSSQGVIGFSQTSQGVRGQSTSSQGVYGVSDTGEGVYGKSTSEDGVFGLSESNDGVAGRSTSGRGVFGKSDTSEGVRGESTSEDGVFGVSVSNDGVHGNSTSGDGVYGQSQSGNGLHGRSTSGFAGLFEGRVSITNVPEDAQNERFVVWGSDNVLKWRTAPSSEGDGIWVLTDGVAATANEVQITTGQGTPISVLDSEGIKVVDGTGATLGGLGRTELETGQRLGVFGRAATSSDLAGLFDGKVEITGMLEVEDVPNDPENERFLVWGSDDVVKWRSAPSGGGDGIWVLVGDVATSETAVQVGGALNTTGPLTVQTDQISSFPGGTHTVLGNGNIARTEPTEGYSIKTPSGSFITHNDPNGNAFFSGNLFASSKSFRIDHPLDPTNRYLQHVSIESPDMMNVYNGNIVTDAEGYATVTLPDYFEALNRDFRYQLTVIGTFAQAIIAEEVEGNRFTIRTSEPGVKVSWQVTGIRQDPWAEQNRVEVEPMKPSAQRGTYMHSEAYGRERR